MKKIFANIILVFLMLGGNSINTNAQVPAYKQVFDNFLNSHLSDYAGNVMVQIGCRGKVLYTFKAGSYNTNTSLEIQSLSKLVTAAVIMTLVEENKFSLNDKAGQYIPSWNANGKQNVTIRQLLAHSSGVVAATDYDGGTNITLAQAVDLIATNTSLLFTPGTNFAYGSSAFKVVSRIAEIVENKPWKQIFAERMANVCGMPNAVYSPNSIDNPLTGQGIVCSIDEYSNFLKMLLNYGMHNSTRVMDSASIVIIEAQNESFSPFGLGQFRENVVNGIAKELYHPGVSGCLEFINRNKDYYGVIFTQAGQGSAGSADFQFRDLVKENISNTECSSTPPVEVPTTCINLNDQCSGNTTEIRSYTINSTAGSKTLKLTYKAHEGASVARIRINNGSWQNINLAQTGTNQYVEISIGTATLNNGNNSIDFSSVTNYVCFRQFCAEGAGSGCTTPAAPSLVANPSSINSGSSSTLSASGCSGGIITWSDALGTGTSKSVSPATTKTYTASCSLNGCTSANGSVTVTVIPPSGGGSTTCVNLNDQCSGNTSEVRSYSINTGSGSFAFKLTYRSHEGPSVARLRINNGSWQTFNLAQTGASQYVETNIGNYTLSNGSNAIDFSSSSGFMCFRQLCAQGAGGGCTTPAAPSLSASPSSINSGSSSTLSSTACSGGTITWSDGLGTGVSKSVTPAATKTYSANCTIGGCVSTNGNVTVTVVPPSGGGCVVNKIRLQFRSAGDCCMDRLVGAKIQGSNNGSSWTDLYTISANGTGSFQEFTFSNTTSYSSTRFVASANGYGELKELEFYNGATKLSGTAFGTSNYATAFDGSTTTDLWHASGESAPFYAGLNLTGCGSTALLSEINPDEISRIKEMQIFPNPNKGIFETSFYLDKGKKATITVVDLQGRVIYNRTITGQGSHREKINLNNKASGTMLLQLHKGAIVETKKINVVR